MRNKCVTQTRRLQQFSYKVEDVQKQPKTALGRGILLQTTNVWPWVWPFEPCVTILLMLISSSVIQFPRLFAALIVRFLTKRFIGDYEANTGEFLPIPVSAFSNWLTVKVLGSGANTLLIRLPDYPPPLLSLSAGALYSRKVTLDGEEVSLQIQDTPCVALQVTFGWKRDSSDVSIRPSIILPALYSLYWCHRALLEPVSSTHWEKAGNTLHPSQSSPSHLGAI